MRLVLRKAKLSRLQGIPFTLELEAVSYDGHRMASIVLTSKKPVIEISSTNNSTSSPTLTPISSKVIAPTLACRLKIATTNGRCSVRNDLACATVCSFCKPRLSTTVVITLVIASTRL